MKLNQNSIAQHLGGCLETLIGWHLTLLLKNLFEKHENLKRQVELLGLEEKQKNKLLADK